MCTIENGPFLYGGDTAGHRNQNSRSPTHRAWLRFVQKITQHGFALLKVGNYTATKWPNDGDPIRRSSKHLVGKKAHGTSAG
jgi:hypothetical protein